MNVEDELTSTLIDEIIGKDNLQVNLDKNAIIIPIKSKEPSESEVSFLDKYFSHNIIVDHTKFYPNDNILSVVYYTKNEIATKINKNISLYKVIFINENEKEAFLGDLQAIGGEDVTIKYLFDWLDHKYGINPPSSFLEKVDNLNNKNTLEDVTKFAEVELQSILDKQFSFEASKKSFYLDKVAKLLALTPVASLYKLVPMLSKILIAPVALNVLGIALLINVLFDADAFLENLDLIDTKAMALEKINNT